MTNEATPAALRLSEGLGVKVLNAARLSREATRLAETFERRTEVSEDVIDAIEVLAGLRDMLALYYLEKDAAHEASQGAYTQAAWLEQRANDEPDSGKRRELLRRAHIALAAADKLRGLA